MKFAIFIILLTSFQGFAINGLSQERINIDFKGKTIPFVLQSIESKYEYKFFYGDSVAIYDQKVDVFARNATIDDVMRQLLSESPFSYKKMNAGLYVIIGSSIKVGDLVIKGHVVGSDQQALGGVSIIEKGTTNGTVTDQYGDFSLKVKDVNAVLVFSNIGYLSQEIVVGNRNQISVTLVSEIKSGEEIVVVGYGTQKKINVTGAVSSIEPKQLLQSPVANISNSLVGRLPGLFAMQTSGEPGFDESRILIRGMGTFAGSTDPLYLVDGVEVTNFNNLDPNEIESLSILKDASSTAVYGIRGANGVIIITTKRGKFGPPQINYTFNQSLNSFTNMRMSMNSSEFASNYNQAQLADQFITNNYQPLRYSPTDIELYGNGEDPIFHPNIQWTDYMFRKTAPQSQHNINLRGGQNRVTYFISAGFFNQSGMFKDFSDIIDEFSPQSSFKRVNLRSNFNFDITKDLKVMLDASSQTEFRSGSNADWSKATSSQTSGTSRLIGTIMKAAPLEGPGVIDGKLVVLSGVTSTNPVLSYLFPGNTGGVRRSYRNFLNISLKANYDLRMILRGLATYGNVAVQTFNNQNIVNTKTVPIYTVFRNEDGSYFLRPDNTENVFNFSQDAGYYRRITSEIGLNYKTTFGFHNITALALYNQQKTYSNNLQFLVPKGYQNYVGRVTYDYNTRYMAEVNIGYNGNENFAIGKRFGLFPAYSAGWVISNESFFPKNDILTFLKLTASYGEVGNDNIGGGRFLYRPTSYTATSNIYYFGLYPNNYKGYEGVVEGASGNPNVTWERVVKRNLQLETRLLENRLSITADLWSEIRNNILSAPNTISVVAGLIQPQLNLGRMQNRGYEGVATYKSSVGKFNYRISANYSFARNKILYMDEVPNTYSYQNMTGLPFGVGKYLLVDGMYNTWEEVNDASRPAYQSVSNKIQPGDLKYRDVNGDGIIDDYDAVPMGYPSIPEKTFGISLSLDYKNFDMSVLFQGAGNVSYEYAGFQKRAGFSVQPYQGAISYLNESWTPERYDLGLPIKFPRFALNNNPNGGSFFLADASYLRLKNMELGYRLTSLLIKKLQIKSCRIYVNGNNLITWSRMLPGIDPEIIRIGNGVVEEPYPQIRTINLGINVTF